MLNSLQERKTRPNLHERTTRAVTKSSTAWLQHQIHVDLLSWASEVKLNSRFEFPRKLDLSQFAPGAGCGNPVWFGLCRFPSVGPVELSRSNKQAWRWNCKTLGDNLIFLELCEETALD